MSETEIMRKGWLAMVKAGAKIWRNNVGTAMQGEQHKVPHGNPALGLRQGDIVIRFPRYVKYGLCEGSSDLIGYLPVTVTPDMVGRTLAVFVAAEAKTEKGSVTSLQTAYLAAVRNDGGVAFLFRSEAEAIEALHV